MTSAFSQTAQNEKDISKLLAAPALDDKALKEVIIAPNTSSTTLENGLQIVVIPDNRAPVVTHMIWYKVGAADEAPRESGIAHFLEHLMFKGTKAYPDGAFSKKVSEIGGQENAFTSWDYTAYYQRVSKEHLPLLMEMEADRMRGLVLTDDVVLPEREVVLEERAQRIDNDPSAQLSETLSATMYQNHPYGVPIIGWQHEIETLSKETALKFYEKFYAPNNAILIVAGDVDAETVKALAEETYGKVAPTKDLKERARPTEPRPLMERRVTLRDERIEQPSLQINFLTPSYTTDEKGKDAPALDVLSTILGGGNSSRLYQGMVANDGVAAYAGAYYRGDGLNDTAFVLYGLPKKVEDMSAIEEQLKKLINEIKEKGITDEELARAKRQLISSTLYAQDSQTTLARIMGTALTTGETIADVQAWPKTIALVTKEDIQNVAKKYFDFDRAVYGLQLPENKDHAS